MNATPFSTQHVPSPTVGAKGERALVLGGGGSTGNAWLIGVIAGLCDAGLDVTTADLTVGTSAGSTAAAQLGGASPRDLFSAISAAASHQTSVLSGSNNAPGSISAPGSGNAVTAHLQRMRNIISAAADAADMRRRMGAAALEMAASSDGSWSGKWRTTVAARLPGLQWPQRKVFITAVDAQSGEPVVFSRDDDVELVDAVAASCASGHPYTIGDRQYIDGAYRRNENADLAAGYKRVLVLAPLSGKTLHPLEWKMQLAAQVAELRASGSNVETIVPESNSEHLFGVNAMDVSSRPAAAQAGYEQGSALAEPLAGFWR